MSGTEVGFVLSEIKIIIPGEVKPEVPMFEQTMSILEMIKEQKETERRKIKDKKIWEMAMAQKQKMQNKVQSNGILKR